MILAKYVVVFITETVVRCVCDTDLEFSIFFIFYLFTFENLNLCSLTLELSTHIYGILDIFCFIYYYCSNFTVDITNDLYFKNQNVTFLKNSIVLLYLVYHRVENYNYHSQIFRLTQKMHELPKNVEIFLTK